MSRSARALAGGSTEAREILTWTKSLWASHLKRAEKTNGISAKRPGLVAYPARADSSSGPLLSRPRGTAQPGVRARRGFAASPGVSLPACRQTAPALGDDPLPAHSATARGGAARAAPGRTAPLCVTKREAVQPAASTGVPGRHHCAAPLPLVASGSDHRGRRLAGGNTKC